VTHPSSPALRRHYVAVVIVWVLTLAALYVFQRTFS
jgi:hypothetical protein